MDKNLQKQTEIRNLSEAIESAGRIALILHISPDGDTCGSALALRRAFVLCGKTVEVVCDDPVPRLYKDLPDAEKTVLPDALRNAPPFDLALAVDVGDRGRMGESARVFDAARHTAQIDHHATNPEYAALNVLCTPLSATGVLAGELIDALGVPMDLPIAECLFAAVATDTGNFKQQNTDAASLRLAARCVEAGLDVQPMTRRLFDLRPFCQSQLLGRALCGMALFLGGRLAMMRLTKEDFAESGALPEHTEGIVNFGINTAGVQIACLLSEAGENGVKCSMRSLPPHDVSRVAVSFGGGGHALAAGCTRGLSMDEAYDALRDALTRELERAE